MKKNIAYARQSLRQEDKASSIIGQIRAIYEYADNEDIELHEHFQDEGSGQTLGRDGIQHVIRLIRNQEVETLIVWRLDRLSRNTKDLLSLFELCESASVKVVSLNDSITSYGNTLDRFKVQLLASVAQWQREIISENKTLGLQEKFKQGHIISTEAPFGYKYQQKTFHLVTEKAYTVRAVFHMYANGLGYKKISQVTDDRDGLIARSPAQVRYILVNPKYTGDYHSKYGVLKNKLPAIISHELFKKADSIRKRKQKPTNYKVPAHLRQKIKCPYCTNIMTTYHYRGQKNSTAKYVCATKMQKQYSDCPMMMIPIRIIEQDVFQIIMNYISSPNELKRLSHIVHSAVIQRHQAALRQKQRSKINQSDLVNQLATGAITSTQFHEQMSEHHSETDASTNVISLQDIQNQLMKLSDILKDHKTLKTQLFHMVDRVELSKNGEISGVFLTGIQSNIKNIKIKESIQDELISYR